MRILAIAALALALAGCQTTREIPIIVNKPVLVEIPKSLLRCDKLKPSDYPNPDTLTDKQVATLLNNLEAINQVCHLNMAGIRKFEAQAKKRLGRN